MITVLGENVHWLSPETALMDFLQSTYAAGANLAEWDRKALER
jgi:hypothetical protein